MCVEVKEVCNSIAGSMYCRRLRWLFMFVYMVAVIIFDATTCYCCERLAFLCCGARASSVSPIRHLSARIVMC